MSKNDANLVLQDLITALALLSRLPVPDHNDATLRPAQSAWAYPLVGAVIGAMAAFAGMLAIAIGTPAPLAAALVLGTLIVSTGAMHEDGLADTADGLWGGWTPTRRLDIMKDSHIGAYGVIALVLSLLTRWAALWVLLEAGIALAVAALISAAMLSRAVMPALMSALPHARYTGLSHSVGQVATGTAAFAAAIACVTAILLLGTDAFMAIFWVAGLTIALGSIAKRKIGGQTGDILGASQQATEIAVLLSILT